jgi:hypothetical protein
MLMRQSGLGAFSQGYFSHIPIEGTTGPFKGAVLNVTGPPVPDIKGTRLEILCKQGTEK